MGCIDTCERMASAVLLVLLSPLLAGIGIMILALAGTSPLIANTGGLANMDRSCG
ncbi:MAG: hypothetical protein LAQ69_11690 [Acidobacteriia bacterium]|nr:hypothetical protein [Terriglobia bacterium]